MSTGLVCKIEDRIGWTHRSTSETCLQLGQYLCDLYDGFLSQKSVDSSEANPTTLLEDYIKIKIDINSSFGILTLLYFTAEGSR